MLIFHDWLLTAARVALHQPTKSAVVADLHLGYHEARCQSGDAVPLLNLDTQLAPLLRVLTNGQVQRLIVAGDLFEKAYDAQLWNDFRGQVLRAGVHDICLVPGNHDRGIEEADLPVHRDGCHVGGWRVVHGDGPLADAPLVLGHFHPSVSHRGRKVPCYLVGMSSLVLPAYSREAAGAYADKRWRGCRCLAIASGRVFEVQR